MPNRKRKPKKSVYLATMVSPDIKKFIIKMANIYNISQSQYLRSLIINDIDERGFYLNELRKILGLEPIDIKEIMGVK